MFSLVLLFQRYAIAAALRDNQRVIYTSPIKALSNQKYREFLDAFGDVGLMTGDVTINRDASCLVMTTEIFRNMLYKGSTLMREASWVVFDEIHYMCDAERGVVWEEVLILMPHNIRAVFLSATVPNALQFAEWICHLHGSPCHVVYTDYRPVPLQHYAYAAKGDGIRVLVDEKGNFRADNCAKTMEVLAAAASEKKTRGGSARADIYRIVQMIVQKSFQPAIVFSFNRKECEANAVTIAQLDMNSDDEHSMVETVFNNALASLEEEDRSLPQVVTLLPLLKRGIGIHHSGLLPILKELTEILFQEGLIKCLFATETFAMGLNMPARTVVFSTLTKFDGKDERPVC